MIFILYCDAGRLVVKLRCSRVLTVFRRAYHVNIFICIFSL